MKAPFMLKKYAEINIQPRPVKKLIQHIAFNTKPRFLSGANSESEPKLKNTTANLTQNVVANKYPPKLNEAEPQWEFNPEIAERAINTFLKKTIQLKLDLSTFETSTFETSNSTIGKGRLNGIKGLYFLKRKVPLPKGSILISLNHNLKSLLVSVTKTCNDIGLRVFLMRLVRKTSFFEKIKRQTNLNLFQNKKTNNRKNTANAVQQDIFKLKLGEIKLKMQFLIKNIQLKLFRSEQIKKHIAFNIKPRFLSDANSNIRILTLFNLKLQNFIRKLLVKELS